MLAKDTLEEFKLECELRRLTPRTIKGYYNSTLLFLTWLERQEEIKELEAIRSQHIKMYIQHLHLGFYPPHGITDQTVNKSVDSFSVCFRIGVDFFFHSFRNPQPDIVISFCVITVF